MPSFDKRNFVVSAHDIMKKTLDFSRVFVHLKLEEIFGTYFLCIIYHGFDCSTDTYF